MIERRRREDLRRARILSRAISFGMFAGAAALVSSTPSASAQEARSTSNSGTPTSADLQNRRLDVDLAFDQTPVANVADQLIGEALGYPYTVDPTVTGTLSFQLHGHLSPAEMLSALSNALSLNGNALVVQQDSILITTAALARSAPMGALPSLAAARDLPPGFVTATLALKVARAADINRLIASVAPRVNVIFTDEARNLVLVAGSREDLQAMRRVIDVFDDTRAVNLSYEVVPIHVADPERLAADVGGVLSRLQIGTVDLIPLQRLGSVVVISRSRAALNIAKTWVATLDVEQPDRAASYRVYTPQHATAAHLAEVLGSLYGNDASGAGAAPASANGAVRSGRFSSDAQTNLLIVRANQSEWRQMLPLLQAVDVPRKQVLIEATIVEVTLNDELRFGLNWLVNGARGSARLTDNTNGSVGAEFPGLSLVYVNGDVTAALTALATRTRVQVMSSPKVLTFDGETAILRVGDEVPVITQTAQGTQNPDSPIVQTLSYRDTGVTLRVTPNINNSGGVAVNVVQEISDVARTTTSGIDSPTFQQRHLESNLSITDGRTVVLGGLISANRTRGRNGVPLLQNVPLLGHLFSSTNNVDQRTELLVFLTPHVQSAADELGSAPPSDAQMPDLSEPPR